MTMISGEKLGAALTQAMQLKGVGPKEVAEHFDIKSRQASRIGRSAQLKLKADHFKKLADEKTLKDTKLAQAKSEKEAAESERSRKRQAKKEGVSIGMSQQAVLESAWGRPERVNRRVTQHGVHEQWAYPGYNYLHFEDGTLTSIHTSKN